MKKRVIHISSYLIFCAMLFSCVNDIDTIKRVTFDPSSPDDVTEN